MENEYAHSPVGSGHIVGETERIVFRHSTIHGTGGYARQKITAGTQVIEYVGEKITKAQSIKRCAASNAYIFTLDSEFDLDGDVAWNPARFINHSCAPNCEAEIDHEQRIWIVALREIHPGEELTFNYNYDLVEYREHPCQCGTPECVGFIVAEEFFDHVRRQSALVQS